MKNIKEIADKFFEEQEKLNISYDSREAFIEGYKLDKEFDEALDSMTSEDWTRWYERFKQKQITRNEMGKDYIVKEDMICPITKSHCDDECCPVGATCNMSALNDMIESGEVSLECDSEHVNMLGIPKTVGGYRLGDEKAAATLRLTYRPNWLHRTMMRLCFGVEWVNDTK